MGPEIACLIILSYYLKEYQLMVKQSDIQSGHYWNLDRP
jgi:hypothetical protein